MKLRFLLFSIILTTTTSAAAGELLLLNFVLTTNGTNTLQRGKVFVTEKMHTWSKGLKLSYLDCAVSRKIQKEREKHIPP